MSRNKLSILFPWQDRITYRVLPEDTWHDLGLDVLVEKVAQQPQEAPLLRRVMESLTDECLSAAKPVDEGARVGVHTSAAQLPMNQLFVFDRDKFEQHAGKEAEEND